MNEHWRIGLILAGGALALGGILHIAIIFGGPSWYARFGAPDHFGRMAAAGHWYPPTMCVLIALVLFVGAGYAFAGAGWIAPWPLQPYALLLIGAALVLRGIVMIPLMAMRPEALARITNSTSVDAFMVVTSVLCLAVGLAYLNGYRFIANMGTGV